MQCEFLSVVVLKYLVSRFELLFTSFGRQATSMVYRRTHQVVKRLAARRNAILAAARDAAAEGGMAAVQIAPVATRANVAAGTVYRYFPSKADLISELIADVSRDGTGGDPPRRRCRAGPFIGAGGRGDDRRGACGVESQAGLGHSRRTGRCRCDRIAAGQPPRNCRRDRSAHRGGGACRAFAGAGHGAGRDRADRRAA